MKSIPNLLVIAIGNPARGDDGLGPRLIEELKTHKLESPNFLWVYQLAIEHAELFSKFPTVIIVDAARRGPGPFQFIPVLPSQDTYFSSHVLRPENVVALTQLLYQARPKVFLLAIRGESFELSEKLSQAAETHLAHSFNFLHDFMLKFPDDAD
ncbi:MAG: hypothetical protein A2X86_17580 [Bdellovibrionales bacterium GWA2_49_15]|nr:MAG: hypothetical protein A2X86_17580 [Bdellovibrionales bacterium GWA2_49_15]